MLDLVFTGLDVELGLAHVLPAGPERNDQGHGAVEVRAPLLAPGDRPLMSVAAAASTSRMMRVRSWVSVQVMTGSFRGAAGVPRWGDGRRRGRRDRVIHPVSTYQRHWFAGQKCGTMHPQALAPCEGGRVWT
ncbi:hypothetical protein GCM10022263_23450 [Nocardioides daeguensis]|uniref:Uncharacterized protein n=1 Tax=Nocardioides daeguensis TaxID=908359 RepID=A0ABP6VJ41_9ACTN